MNINQIRAAIANGDFDDSFNILYRQTAAARQRYLDALDRFEEIYKTSGDIRLFSAPGRTEIGGNHTDHQHGCVLAASVNLDVIAVVGKNDDEKIRIKSEGFDMDEVDINDLGKKEEETGRSSALIRGVCKKFADMGAKLGGFNAYTTSNVLKGSGLSSSAAFEVLVGNILNNMFFDSKADAVTIAKIGQFAEKEYFGKPCGLLDQTASSMGGFTYADFADPQNPVCEKIELDVEKYGYTLCVVDTGGNHADLTDDYAGITVECRKVSNALGVSVLRDADVERFYREIPVLREECGDRAVLRAFHFFNEQERVEKQKTALEKGDFKKFLKLVNASGQSSCDYLQNLYSVSAVQEQGLVLALALTKQFLGEDGACRVHGGGFAGTIQCYIPSDKMSEYKTMIESVFGGGSCQILSIRPVGGYEIK